MTNATTLPGFWTVNLGGDIHGEYKTRAGAQRAAKRSGGTVEWVPPTQLAPSSAAPWG